MQTLSRVLSVLTLGEIQKGISGLANSSRKIMLQSWLDTDLRQRFSDRVLPVTEDVALTWGILHGTMEAKGRPLPTIDGLLGATALAYNLTIVTRNDRDIERTGVRLFNPWK
jgi:predicted nucleic acid-binding protein